MNTAPLVVHISRWTIVLFLLLLPATGLSQNSVIRLDSRFDQIIAADAKVEKLAGDLKFTEGPVWDRRGKYLLFTDIRLDTIFKWDSRDNKVTAFLERSGSGGRKDTPSTPQSGANGTTMDKEGRLIICAQGDRQIERLERDGTRTVLASEYNGKRLNRTNDVVVKSDGSIYFTDPPQPGAKPIDLDFAGVFRIKDGKVTLLIQDNPSPNGVAFSPDEKYLYTNTTNTRLVYRHEVQKNGTVANGKVFVDMTGDSLPGGPDGMRVDKAGNLYSTGPGGVWIITPSGQHIGTILTPEVASNMAFGDADGKTLYITARTGVYRIRLKQEGIRP